MRLDEGLRAHLAAAAGVAILASNRISPAPLPQGETLPALTYQVISRVAQYSHSGASGLTRPRLQVDCWGETYDSAQGLAEQVRLALSGFRGQMGDVHVRGLFQDGATDLYEPDTGIYHVSLDFVGWVAEPVP